MSTRLKEPLRLPHPDGGTLHGEWSHAGRPDPWAVVYVHGFGSTRAGEKAQAVEAACARRGWTYAAFDFRGHGETGGSLLDLRGSGLLADLDVAGAGLAARGVRRLGLVGSSMGGWASAWFALRRPEAVAACVLLAPAVDFLRHRWAGLTDEQRRQWREAGRLRVRNRWVEAEIGYGVAEEMDRFRVEDLAEGLARPLLIYHGMRDDTVPYQQSLSFVEQARHGQIELRLLKDGDHRLTAYKDEMAEAACAFFVRCEPLA